MSLPYSNQSGCENMHHWSVECVHDHSTPQPINWCGQVLNRTGFAVERELPAKKKKTKAGRRRKILQQKLKTFLSKKDVDDSGAASKRGPAPPPVFSASLTESERAMQTALPYAGLQAVRCDKVRYFQQSLITMNQDSPQFQRAKQFALPNVIAWRKAWYARSKALDQLYGPEQQQPEQKQQQQQPPQPQCSQVTPSSSTTKSSKTRRTILTGTTAHL